MLPIDHLSLAGVELDAWTLLGRGPAVLFLLWLFRAGLARGWRWRRSLLATAAMAGGYAVGAALLPSVLGAAAGGVAAWFLAQAALRLRRPPLAALALGGCALIAVGRLGCLLGGCCFGTASDLPWAIRYGPGSPALALHRELGWVAAGAGASLGLHPIQLYESLGLGCWLLAALPLRRRLRSEAALAWLSAAVLLALRAVIDGRRAMINVWWALAGGGQAIDRFRLALAGAAFLALAAALLCEGRARSSPRPGAARGGPPAEAGPLPAWAVFLCTCGAAVLTDGAQTPLLHALSLAAVLAACLALQRPLPAREARPARGSVVPALARTLLSRSVAALAALVLLVLINLHRRASAREGSGATAAAGAPEPASGQAEPDLRAWIYQADPRRGVLVRLGNALDGRERLDAVRQQLGLPGPDEPKAPERLAPGGSRLWLAAGGAGWSQSTKKTGCGGGYTLYQHAGGSVWGRAEVELPLGSEGTFWGGGRAGWSGDAGEVTSSGSSTQSRDRLAGAFGQAWLEVENRNAGIGASLLAVRLSGSSAVVAGAQPGGGGLALEERWRVLPGGHLRLGAAGLGFDAGFLDRSALLGPLSARVGISGAVGLGQEITRLSEAPVHYFVGLVAFPSAYSLATSFGPGGDGIGPGLGLHIEFSLTPAARLGFEAVGGPGGVAGGVQLRYALGLRDR